MIKAGIHSSNKSQTHTTGLPQLCKRKLVLLLGLPGHRGSLVTILAWTICYQRASLVTQTVKNLLTMWETRVQLLGQEDPLEKGMATHSSILAWRIPWTEETGGLQSMGSQRVRHDWATNTHTHTHTHMGIQWMGSYVRGDGWRKERRGRERKRDIENFPWSLQF